MYTSKENSNKRILTFLIAVHTRALKFVKETLLYLKSHFDPHSYNEIWRSV